ncbi:hypothetical protein PCANC_25575 [Puccinia coronata f. sp. avenae]|uniref:Protein-serine/threonine kinase n=1 Tax=Puccinia coronata f. sp. avenae TaxID=200324 RepID=A0A2N5S1R4_9BASI|nr:hypothetical protein PCANC_25575 [Puccinia coronata f. sp. avenae]
MSIIRSTLMKRTLRWLAVQTHRIDGRRHYQPSFHRAPSHQNPRLSFYRNSHVLRYAAMEIAPFSLRQLIFLGKVLSRNGSNSEELDHSLIQGANFVSPHFHSLFHHHHHIYIFILLSYENIDGRLTSLCTSRLGSSSQFGWLVRFASFQSLPYIVTSNPYLTETYEIYVEAFEKIRSYPEVGCRIDNQHWCQFLQSLLNQHKVVIPKLLMIFCFWTSFRPSLQPRACVYLGVIDTELEIGKVIDKCIHLAQTTLNLHPLQSSLSSSQAVQVHLRGERNGKFAYLPDHLEFIVFELLLNAFRATVASAAHRSMDIGSLPIDVQIASSATHITIRISDQAGGISQPWLPNFSDGDDEALPPTVSRREMFSFVNLATANDSLKELISSTDGTMEGKVREQVDHVQQHYHSPSSPLSSPSSSPSTNTKGFEQVQEARLRIGLPLSSIYAQFFGGSLEMYSIPGFSDIVLCIPKLGTTTEPYH